MIGCWHPKLVLITAIEEYGESLTIERAHQHCQRFAPGGVMLQLRDKGLGMRARLRMGAILREVTAKYGQGFAVNDRIDLAVLLDADGVHLGEDAVTAEDARQILGAAAWISRACHEPESAMQSRAVDAVLLSPVLAPRKGRPALGHDGLRRARKLIEGAREATGGAVSVQLFALGGVDLGAMRECESAGADGIAVIGAAWRDGTS